MAKRACSSCGKSLRGRHGNAVYCTGCRPTVKNERAKQWWKENDYSKVVAERRAEAKLGLDNIG